MDIEQLRSIASEVMRELKQELQKTGNSSPYFEARLTDGTSQKFPVPAGHEDVLNSGRAKDIIFEFFRMRTADGGIAAWIFGTDVWSGRATKEGQKHSPEEHHKHTDSGFKKLQAMGWVDVFEAIVINAQTPTDVLMLRQFYIREKNAIRWVGQPEEHLFKPDEFGGRQKMWNATPDDATGFDPTRKKARQ